MGRGDCRLAVLASHPIQYFTPLYRLLANTPGLQIAVMFCRDFGVKVRYDKQFGKAFAWDTDQLSGYPHRFLTNISPIRDTFNPLHAINPGAFLRLLRGFDALWVNGYTYPSNWMAMFGAKLRGTRLLYRSDFRLDPRRPAKATDKIRDHAIRWWIRRSDALLYIGHANRQAYLHYGATESKLFFAPFSVDVEALTAARNKVRNDLRRYRDAWGVPHDRTVVLFAGKLTPGKHPETVLTLAQSAVLRDRIHVVFAGSGPMEAELRARAKSEGLDNVTFLGFVNQSKIPEVYALSDVFAMPAEREAWGLAVNEAMVAGAIPVISSEVGASADLVRGRETGFEIPPANVQSLQAAVCRLVDEPKLRERLSQAAILHASTYSYAATTTGILDALRALGIFGGAAIASES